MDSSTPLSVESAVIFIVFILVLATVLRTSGKMLRRHVFGFARGDELDAAFPTFGYQKFAGRAEVSGLGDFGELYNRLGFNIGGLLHNGWPEIHHLLCDYEDDMVMSLFDLRRPATRSFGARYSSCILLTNPGTRLTPFTLSQETLAHISLWGKDPDIDIEGFFRFSQNYFLTSTCETATRRLFETRLAAFVDQNTLFFASAVVRCRGCSALVECPGPLPPERLQNAYRTSKKLMGHLLADAHVT